MQPGSTMSATQARAWTELWRWLLAPDDTPTQTQESNTPDSGSFPGPDGAGAGGLEPPKERQNHEAS